MEIRTIMVPLDGSDFARRALPAARDLARRSEARLLLAYVHAGPPPAEPGEAPESLVEADRAVVRAEREALEEAAREVRAAGLEAETDFSEGPVAETLAARARERADLVVMATHGRGAFSRFWLGSVADELARRTPVPLLFVRPGGEGEGPGELAAEHVLLPLDGSRRAERILDPARSVGRLFGARYTVLRVLVPAVRTGLTYEELPVDVDAETIAEQEEAASEYVEEALERLRRAGETADGRVVRGPSAAAEIHRVAEEEDVDLVAMATHGWGGLKRMLLGSVADKVLRAGDRPLLLHRPRAGR